jgi:hypothetical protein
MNDPFDLDTLPEVENPPGQLSVAYRLAPYGQLREGMLRGISRDNIYLRDLNTRDPADPTIALVDSWAVAGDVLGFYAERIANESWLKTATERRSIRSLARLIDYELCPGKSADTWLAFTLESAPGAPPEVVIPVGVKVNSIPGPGEVMVSFETIEEITARPSLNAMKPRMTRAQSLDDVEAAQSARCSGILSDVKRGDWLVLVKDDAQDLKRVEASTTLAAEGVTQIDFAVDPPRAPIFFFPMTMMTAYVPPMFGVPFTGSLVTGQVSGILRDQTSFEAELQTSFIPVTQVVSYLNAIQIPTFTLPTETDGLFRFKSRAAVFGHNIVQQESTDPLPPTMDAAFSGRLVKLDSEITELRPNSCVAFVSPGQTDFITRIGRVETVTAATNRFSSRVTRIEVEDNLPAAWNNVSAADVMVLVDARNLRLAALPVTEDVAGSSLPLNAFHAGLSAGRPIAVTGERSDLPGVVQTEIHDMTQVLMENGYTRLELASAVIGPFKRDSVAINGNLAKGTHGETGGQPLGHGAAARANQRFRLPIIPLTHVGASTPSGVAAALSVWVGGILWSEVESLRDAGPLDRVYALSYAEDGSTWVQFGDGVKGRRLPSGTNNVAAVWRRGLGSDGMVKAGQISLLSGAPQGVKSVLNPLAATGAANGETLDDARDNAPLSVLTLGRIVTLHDYEDFARSFSGIAKAHAIWAWTGTTRAVFLTVAGIDGAQMVASDMANLAAAIAKASDTAIVVTISPHIPVWFKLEANIRVFADRVADDVILAIEQRLREDFSFDQRALGQSVARSEVIAAIQSVDGVDWVDLDALYRGDTVSNAAVVNAAVPRSGRRLAGASVPSAAEHLSITPGPLTLRIMP